MATGRSDDDVEEVDNGLLANATGVETTAIGIVDGTTAQIDVELPTTIDDDDYVDDGIVIDETTFAALELAEEADAEVAEGDVEDDSVIETDGDIEDAIEEAGESAGEPEAVPAGEPEVEASSMRSLFGAPRLATDAEHDQAQENATEPTVDDETSIPDDSALEDSAAEESPAREDEPELVDSIVEAQAASTDVTPEPEPRAVESAGSVAPRHADDAHASHQERLRPRTSEIALQSRRLGDFDAARESADLLTSDRLLDPAHVVRPEPEGTWRRLVYTLSGRRINLGDSKAARDRKALDRRISASLHGGAKFVPVLSRKGGVGKTTVTTLLGMALADTREDRIIAVDANPDRGTLAERIGRSSGKTARDLVRARGDVHGFNDISQIVARDQTRLDVIASDADPHVSEAFSDTDYQNVADIAAHFYSVVLTDTGTGIVHSVMGATLDRADELVIVAGLSIDEARLASETLTWLETNGYAEQVRSAVVVLNTARPGAALVRADELEAHFRTRVRSVVRVPYDSHIASGGEISFRELQPATREAARNLAAIVIEGLRARPVA